MKSFLPQEVTKLNFCVLFAGLFFVLPFVSWGQVIISNTTTTSYIDDLTNSTGSASPSNWTIQGTGTRGTTWNTTSQLTGTSGGWYGNGNISFLGTGTSALNGNATWLLKNESGSTIIGFTLSFTGKLHKAGTASPNVNVSYSFNTSNTDPAAGNLTNLNDLSFNDATSNISTGVLLTQSISSISIPNNNFIFIRFIHPGGSNSDNLGWDDIKFEPVFGTPPICSEPTTAATNLSFSSVQQNQMSLNWINGNGTERIVVSRLNAPIGASETPTDGVSYTANTAFGTNGTALGDGFVVYKGTGSNATITQLAINNTYHFAVFEVSCSPENYKTDVYAVSNQTTLNCLEPTQVVNSITTPIINEDEIKVSWAFSGNGTSHIVFAKAGSDFTASELPNDGTTYTSNPVFGNGSSIGNAFAVYKGIGTAVTVYGLSPTQTYYFRVYELSCSPENYLTSSYAEISATTISGPWAKYSFNGALGDEASFASDANPINGTASNLSRNGINPSTTAGTFNSTGFSTVANSGIDLNKYYTFSVAPNTNYKLTLTKLELDERRSNTGIANWSVRSNLDNYATDLATFSVPDNDLIRTDNVINLGSDFTDLTAPVQFRIYGYNAESTAGSWRIDNLQAFGNTSPNNPLPVSLIFFDAKAAGNKVSLTWATASEKDNKQFDVQRSNNGENFTTITTVAGKGTTNQIINYQAFDDQPLNGISYYRLKQVDFDGTESYSKIVAVNSRSEKSTVAVYPNPAGNNLTVSFTGEAKSIAIMNMLGQEILNKPLLDASNSVKMDIATLPAGAYQVIVTTAIGRSTQKFVKIAQ